MLKKSKALYALLLVPLMALFSTSCSTYKKINYLQDVVPDKAERIAINKGILIQPKDMISIVVSSKNPELALMFNLPVVSYQAGSEVVSGQGSQRLLGYVVDNDGNIDFPVLGLIKAAGLTRWELANEIKGMIIDQGYIKDPVVTVEFMIGTGDLYHRRGQDHITSGIEPCQGSDNIRPQGQCFRHTGTGWRKDYLPGGPAVCGTV